MIEEILRNSKYMKPVIVIQNEDSEILTSNSLCLIKGEVGSGKSRFAMNIMVGLSGVDDDLNLKYNACPDGKHVVYISTEMSKYHMQRRLIKVLDNTPPEYEDKLKFYDFSLSTNRHGDLDEVLTKIKPYVVIIDQLGDFTSNINDIEKATALLKWLTELIEKHSCSMICILHQNEDAGINGKARGHLGSFLEQKTVSSIAVAVNSKNEFKLKSTKLREGVHFELDAVFNTKTEMLIATEAKNPMDTFNKINFPINATNLIKVLCADLNKGETYVRKIITEWVDNNLMTSRKDGKQVFYDKPTPKFMK